MAKLQELLSGLATGPSFNVPRPGTKDYAEFQASSINAGEGKMNEEDGYDCRICKNKGYVAVVVERPGGKYGYSCRDCRCAETRESIMRMKRSGLEKVIKDLTFDKYEDVEPWQKHIKEKAKAYAEEPKGWFYIGGQPGCGKTHLCTAICRELLLRGMPVMYMKWREDITRLKALAMDAEVRQREVDKLKRVKVLYIDDLFKTGRNPDGSEPKPTSADINIAQEIVNYRYGDPELFTIISGELSISELVDIDEALGSRILERSKPNNGLSIARDRVKNYRFRGEIVL